MIDKNKNLERCADYPLYKQFKLLKQVQSYSSFLIKGCCFLYGSDVLE